MSNCNPRHGAVAGTSGRTPNISATTKDRVLEGVTGCARDKTHRRIRSCYVDGRNRISGRGVSTILLDSLTSSKFTKVVVACQGQLSVCSSSDSVKCFGVGVVLSVPETISIEVSESNGVVGETIDELDIGNISNKVLTCVIGTVTDIVDVSRVNCRLEVLSRESSRRPSKLNSICVYLDTIRGSCLSCVDSDHQVRPLGAVGERLIGAHKHTTTTVLPVEVNLIVRVKTKLTPVVGVIVSAKDAVIATAGQSRPLHPTRPGPGPLVAGSTWCFTQVRVIKDKTLLNLIVNTSVHSTNKTRGLRLILRHTTDTTDNTSTLTWCETTHHVGEGHTVGGDIDRRNDTFAVHVRVNWGVFLEVVTTSEGQLVGCCVLALNGR